MKFLLKKIASHKNRFIKFAFVGGSGFFVNMFCLYALKTYCNLDTKFSSPIAIEISILSNFVLNYFWTWKYHVNSGSKTFFVKMWQYNFSMLITAFLNYILLQLLEKKLNIMYMYANATAIIVVMFLNYFILSNYTFKGKNYEKSN